MGSTEIICKNIIFLKVPFNQYNDDCTQIIYIASGPGPESRPVVPGPESYNAGTQSCYWERERASVPRDRRRRIGPVIPVYGHGIKSQNRNSGLGSQVRKSG